MGYRDYSTAKGHIVDPTGLGDFTTITAALNAASSGQTIVVRPGTYTENPPLKAGVDVVAYTADAFTPNVIINGKCTFSSAGTVTLSGICLQTNSDFCLSVTGSAASLVYLRDCYINCTINTGVQLTSSSSSSSLRIDDCRGDVGTTGIALYTMSGAGNLQINSSYFTNSGGSTTSNSTSAGTTIWSFSSCDNPIATSSSATTAFSYSNINTSAQNATCMSSTGTSTVFIDSTNFTSGTASALNIGSGTTVEVLSTSYIDSTNANAITGSGTINYGLIVYTNTSSTNNVTTQKALPTQPGGWKLIQTSTASSSASISFTSLGTYTNYMLIWSNVLPASGGGQTLQLQYNQGSGFVTSGYSGSGLFANTAGGPGKITTITASAVLGDALGNTTPACSGQCLISNVQFASSTSATFTTSVSNDMGSNGAGIYGGSLGNTAAITQFKVSMASGNIAQGAFSLYGLSS